MAVVRGIREKVHLPLYDAKVFKVVPPHNENDTRTITDQLREGGNIIKFFVDVQGKTKLETNQQESSVLSHYNTYEVRAIRVVIEPPKALTSSDDEKKDIDFLSDFIYNSVTSFIVGEKVMVQAPTWFFPSGAGPSNWQGTTNGSPSPEATLRLAEPVSISHQQNYRVEIEFPRGTEELSSFGRTDNLSAKIWVVLDGYITRDVQ